MAAIDVGKDAARQHPDRHGCRIGGLQACGIAELDVGNAAIRQVAGQR
jgi:hypothetical protein